MQSDESSAAIVEERAERWHQLRQLESWLEKPMIVLSIIWLLLLILELTRGLSGFFEAIGTAIWIAVIVDFSFVSCSLLKSELIWVETG